MTRKETLKEIIKILKEDQTAERKIIKIQVLVEQLDSSIV